MAAADARMPAGLGGLHARTIPLDAKLGNVLSHGLELAGAGVVLLWRHASPSLVRFARSTGQTTQLPYPAACDKNHRG